MRKIIFICSAIFLVALALFVGRKLFLSFQTNRNSPKTQLTSFKKLNQILDSQGLVATSVPTEFTDSLGSTEIMITSLHPSIVINHVDQELFENFLNQIQFERTDYIAYPIPGNEQNVVAVIFPIKNIEIIFTNQPQLSGFVFANKDGQLVTQSSRGVSYDEKNHVFRVVQYINGNSIPPEKIDVEVYLNGLLAYTFIDIASTNLNIADEAQVDQQEEFVTKNMKYVNDLFQQKQLFFEVQ